MPSTIVIRKKLDMTPGAVPTVVHRSQYDSDFTIIFELFARTGEFVIESGTTARLRGTKTSGTGYSVPIPLDIATKTVTITGDAQMTVAAGNNIFEVVLYLNDLEICSSNFVLAIERAAMDKDTITDATVVPELERLDEYIEQAADIAAREGAAYAESWAVGGTGKRPDEDTNNAKYWAEHAEGVVHGVTSFNGRTGAVIPTTGDYKSGMIRRGNSTTTVEDTLTSLGSITADLGSRMATAEDAISSQGTRLDTAESDIDALEGRATTAESNITALQNSKVDMTTPLLNFDDTATDPLTDDGALANALSDLGILGTVALNGILYVKKTLTELSKVVAGLKTTVASHTTRLRNFEVVVNDYFGNNTTGQTHTYTLKTGCCYLMCFGRTNGSSGSGLYFIQAHSTTSQILPIAASSYITPTITSLTLNVKIDTNYGQIYILKLGGIET